LIKMQPQSDKLTPERRMWASQLAQLYGALGHTSESAGQKNRGQGRLCQRRRHLGKARRRHRQRRSRATGLTWSKGRLAKLK
jgi:hypothetical protein